MDVYLRDVLSNQKVVGEILEAAKSDMPTKKYGWKFTWRTLYKTEGSEFYKLILKSTSEEIQGMLMISLMNEEMLYMNNIEVAPQNYGKNGRYDLVAGCLIAFACMKSFQLGKDFYRGFLTFESKTALIPLYQKKYGAILVAGKRMYIPPEMGLELIKTYLN